MSEKPPIVSVWKQGSDGTPARTFARDARMGPPENLAQNAVTVKASEFRGTLGPAFNWKPTRTPCVQLTMALPDDGSTLQDELVTAMQAFADKFIADHNLEPVKR